MRRAICLCYVQTMDSQLIFGLAVSMISLSVRWRFPAVPPPLATFGIITGLGFALWTFTAAPLALTGGWIISAALFAAIVDSLASSPKRIRPGKIIANGGQPLISDRERARAERRKQDAILYEISQTKRLADDALAADYNAEMRAALPRLRATFLTMQREYQIPLLDLPIDAPLRRCMQASSRYLHELHELLRQGHAGAAVERANALKPMLEAYMSQQSDDLA